MNTDMDTVVDQDMDNMDIVVGYGYGYAYDKIRVAFRVVIFAGATAGSNTV